jgi:DNA-binding response OmpR family regulator
MRLLVVEDDVKLARALERGLQREGYAVDLAETGDDALSQATENDYDAVVLDVMLPGALIRRGPTERPPVLEVGDLRIDPASRSVTRAGREVELTVREFALLQFLAQRAGSVVSREELLEHVWETNEDGSTNVVDVYVGYLRNKVERPFKGKIIRTVRGIGFMLEEK